MAIQLRAGKFAGFDSRRAVAPALTVTVTVCAVPPVTWGPDGLKLQVSSDVPEQARETGPLNPDEAFNVAVNVAVPP
jgi:hypothetical protein